MPVTIIYEEVVEDREQFLHRSLWNWAHGRMPWSDGEEEHRQQRHHDDDEEEEEEPFRPPQAVQENLRETTWAAAGARLQAECAVCLKDFEAEDMVRTIIPCGHCFHQGCILPWLRVSCVCPLCRRALTTA